MGGSMNRSSDDYEEYEDEWGERPAFEWIKHIEANGDQFEMADRGMGFLTLALKTPEGEIKPKASNPNEVVISLDSREGAALAEYDLIREKNCD